MTQVANKTVQVIARIQYKNNVKAVVYIVRSSDGQSQYRTTIYNNKATACSCPSRVRCYHMNQLEVREVARYESWQAAERAKLVEVLDSCSHEALTVAVPLPKMIQVPVLAVIVVKSIMAQIEAVARQASLEVEYQNLLDAQVSQYEGCENCGGHHKFWNCPL
jgi:hypothetical protein